MKSQIIFALGILILCSTIVSVNAEVTQVNYVYNGTIDDNGNLVETQNPIANFNVIGFICDNADCSDVAGTLWGGSVQNSGASSQIVLTYPTILQNSGYGIFFYKEGYFPYAVRADWAGTGQASNGTRYLTRKTNCQVPINHLNISHEGNRVTVNVTLDASVSSPVNRAGPLNYVPSSIAHLFAVDSKVDFRFIGPQNISLSRNVSLPASESREVIATTTLAAGEYSIEIESNTADAKCINSVPLIVHSNLLIENNRTNTTLPTIAILSPEPRLYTNRTILVNLRSTDATSVFYNINNGANVSYNSPVFVNFNEGVNTLTAYAVNNVTTARTSVIFNVNTSINNQTQNDTTPPGAVTNLQLSSTGANFLTWTWNNPLDADFNHAIIYLNDVNVVNTSNNFYNAIGLNANTTYTIRINTKDFSGNVNLTNVISTGRTLAINQTINNTNPKKPTHNKNTNKLKIMPDEENESVNSPLYFDEEPLLEIAQSKAKSKVSFFWPVLLLIACLILLILLVILASNMNGKTKAKNNNQFLKK